METMLKSQAELSERMVRTASAMVTQIENMNQRLAEHQRAIDERLAKLQFDFDKRIKEVEAKTSPRRKQARVDDEDMDAAPTGPGPAASSSASGTSAPPPTTRAAPTPPPSTARARSAPPSNQSVVLLKLPEPVIRSRADSWLQAALGGLPSPLPAHTTRVQDFHDYVVLGFATSDDARDAAGLLRDRDLSIPLRSGGSGRVIVISDRPPDVRRRGAGLHPLYTFLAAEMLTDQPDSRIRPIHRARGSVPHTVFYRVNGDESQVHQLAVARWTDDGENFVVREVLPGDDLPDNVKAKLLAQFRT